MNPNEAIQILSGTGYSQDERKQASMVLREAADKRTARKPESISADQYNLYECPACGKDVYIIHGFCRYCGQAIDWS